MRKYSPHYKMSCSTFQPVNIPNFEHFGIDLSDVKPDPEPPAPKLALSEQDLQDLEDFIFRDAQKDASNGRISPYSDEPLLGPTQNEFGEPQPSDVAPDVFSSEDAHQLYPLPIGPHLVSPLPFQDVKVHSGDGVIIHATLLPDGLELQEPAGPRSEVGTPHERVLLLGGGVLTSVEGAHPALHLTQESYLMQIKVDVGDESWTDRAGPDVSVDFAGSECSWQSEGWSQLQEPPPSVEAVANLDGQSCSATGKKRRGRKPESGLRKRWESEAHKKAEVKRRQKIQDMIKETYRCVPSLKSHKKRTSELTAVAHTVKHLRELTIQKERVDTEYNRVLDERKALMRDIEQFQDQLPQQGLRREEDSGWSLDDQYQEHVKRQGLLNEKYWLYHCVMQHVFESYKKNVSATSGQQFLESLDQWVNSSLGLTTFRPAVIEAQVEIARRTSVMTRPDLVPTEIRAILCGSSQNVT